MTDQNPIFLSTLYAARRERRLAIAVVLVSLVLFAFIAPFAKTPLKPVWAFIPVYETALVVNDLITAVLLMGQFAILRSRALVVLATGYVFSAAITVFHALTFPGLFSATGLLGASPQSTAWLYMFWHGGFPLFLIAYALIKRVQVPVRIAKGPVTSWVLLCAATGVGLALLAVGVAVHGAQWLPPIMQNNHYTPAMLAVVSTVWGLTLLALGVLWRRRPHSLLDIWLMVVLCAWLLDIALSAVLNAGRFDLGFYAGRIYGMFAASFVLSVLLLENSRLHATLFEAHRRERQRSADLERVSAELETTNTELADRNRQLQDADRLKSEFLANMSHELRTPLNAIIGFSELLKDGLVGDLTEKQRSFIGQVFLSGQHLLGLINDILDLSKVESGKMSLDLEDVDLKEVLETSLLLFQDKADTRHIGLRLDVHAGRYRMFVDARKLRQMVYNLLSNAMKFSPDGGQIRLSMRRVKADALDMNAPEGMSSRVLPLPGPLPEEFLELRVCDTGIGMAAEDLQHLFQVFRQIDSSLTRRHEGTGLGLAMVSRLAALHGGSVGVASAPGQGAHFAVWLPWRPTQAARFSTGATNEDTGNRPKRTAWVIEDDPDAAELLRLHLEDAGFGVTWLLDGADLAVGAKAPPDLIALDLLLSNASGWDVLDQIRSDPALCAVPVVIVSLVPNAQKGFALGASKVLQKPVTRELLLAALAELGLRRPASGPYAVLVVDDDPQALELIAHHLEQMNCVVTRASDGQTAIDTARTTPPDLMILDLMMPDVSGFEVVEALKREPHTAELPILILTAKNITREDRQRLSGSVLKIMEKGRFSRQQFLNEVHRVLP